MLLQLNVRGAVLLITFNCLAVKVISLQLFLLYFVSVKTLISGKTP